MASHELQVVRPLDSRSEVLWFLIAFAIVIVVWIVGIHGRSRAEKHTELLTWQISAFQDLNMAEQGLFGDLRNAAQDILNTYVDEDQQWPRLERLREEGTPPFAEDIAWKNRGKLYWRDRVQNSPEEQTLAFFGLSSEIKVSGSFLLLVHDHQEDEKDEPPYSIWYHAGRPVEPKILSDQSLAATGWKQVIPYLGQDEVQRLKGIEQ